MGLGSIEIVQGLGVNKFCAKVLGSFFWNHISNLGLGAGLGWVEGLGWPGLGWVDWAVGLRAVGVLAGWAGLGWGLAGLGWTAGLGWLGLGWAPATTAKKKKRAPATTAKKQRREKRTFLPLKRYHFGMLTNPACWHPVWSGWAGLAGGWAGQGWAGLLGWAGWAGLGLGSGLLGCWAGWAGLGWDRAGVAWLGWLDGK